MIVLALAAAISGSTFYGATLGTNVRALVGAPFPEVVTSDVGQIWTWRASQGAIAMTMRATTDDDGTIQMIDVLARGTPGGPELEMPLPSRERLTFGSAQATDADAIFGAPEFEGAGAFPDGNGQASFRGYRFEGDREAVLLFDAGGGPLREMFFGKRSALARAGLIPHEAPPDIFKAASLSRLGSADFSKRKEGVAYTRIVVDADGSVASATVFVSSGDADLDGIALAIDRGCSFVPASLNGAPVASVYFRREEFLLTDGKN
ncbi:MAG: energy transducer TonB [Candidatus Eremiobacteraeota bacterium]|nr:energy transducer TonB [Candidatus Eremiobacteraeota bacterium]